MPLTSEINSHMESVRDFYARLERVLGLAMTVATNLPGKTHHADLLVPPNLGSLPPSGIRLACHAEGPYMRTAVSCNESQPAQCRGIELMLGYAMGAGFTTEATAHRLSCLVPNDIMLLAEQDRPDMAALTGACYELLNLYDNSGEWRASRVIKLDGAETHIVLRRVAGTPLSINICVGNDGRYVECYIALGRFIEYINDLRPIASVEFLGANSMALLFA